MVVQCFMRKMLGDHVTSSHKKCRIILVRLDFADVVCVFMLERHTKDFPSMAYQYKTPIIVITTQQLDQIVVACIQHVFRLCSNNLLK